MIPLTTLGMFLLALTALLVSPGPNMAFVLSHGIAHGPRGGVAAALGICAADCVMTLLAAFGVTAIVAAWAPAFDLLRYAGAAWLLWLAWKALRTPGGLVLGSQRPARTAAIFRHAMFNSLLNPKALLFFIVFLPQFVDGARPVLPQVLVLGVVLTCCSLLFHGALGLFGGSLGGVLARRAGSGRAQGVFLALVMAGLALRLLFLERPATR